MGTCPTSVQPGNVALTRVNPRGVSTSAHIVRDGFRNPISTVGGRPDVRAKVDEMGLVGHGWSRLRAMWSIGEDFDNLSTLERLR